jgi:hypothetical protein
VGKEFDFLKRDPDGSKLVVTRMPIKFRDIAILLRKMKPDTGRDYMKALSAETKTFSALSALSSLTGPRGGNLLFHLQKLQDGGMILQRNERGDYMITEKGYRTLRGVSELYLDLGSKRVKAEPTKAPQASSV